MVYSKENCNIPKIQRGPTFSSGGSNFYRGWVGGGGGGWIRLLVPMETYRTCHFPGGSGPPVPIWIWACDFFFGG